MIVPHWWSLGGEARDLAKANAAQRAGATETAVADSADVDRWPLSPTPTPWTKGWGSSRLSPTTRRALRPTFEGGLVGTEQWCW